MQLKAHRIENSLINQMIENVRITNKLNVRVSAVSLTSGGLRVSKWVIVDMEPKCYTCGSVNSHNKQ